MVGSNFKFAAIGLCIFIAAIFVVQNIIPGFTDTFVLDSSRVSSEPYLLVTSIFLHGSAEHLLSNLFALGLFGSILESIIGIRKFFLIFFSTGIIASIAAALFYASSLGASGAIFGVLGVLTALRPKMMVWTYGVPMPMFIAAGFWLILDLAGVFYPSSIANTAHIAGLISGVVVGLAIRKQYSQGISRKEKILAKEELDKWEKEYM